LTKNLAPVREVLKPEDLDFNQLLQRDLDDHRVASALIPYLLERNETGPAFFPPIIAVLLPFDDRTPSTFPSFKPPADEFKVHTDDRDLAWHQWDSGEHARVRRLADEDGAPHTVNLAQLWWNPEHARLLVLDGQHRAMALLALDRTISKSWEGSTGERYRYFYEDRIRTLLRESEDSVDLSGVEVPVAVTWLPDDFGPKGTPHLAARKLFVDVNREARQPSESRLILLSDSELLNVFTRGLLSELRGSDDASLVPLEAVEYDNPEPDISRSVRWSVSTNIYVLRQMTKRLVFGPPKYQLDVTAQIARRENESEKDSTMRQQLWVEDLFKVTFDDEGTAFDRNRISNLNFPLSKVDALESRFMETWGSVVLTILSKIEPYAAHSAALRDLKSGWSQTNDVDRLAFDALFGSVGMFWTLRSTARAHDDLVRRSKGVNTPAKPQTVSAWEVVEAKKPEFEKIRTKHYLNNQSDASIKGANLAFELFNSHACQVGLALTAVNVWLNCVDDRKRSQVPGLGDLFASAINAWMGSATQPNRKLFLNREPKANALNLISKLDAPRAVEFRYFWLEVLASSEALVVLEEKSAEPKIRRDRLEEQRDEARAYYLSYCTKQRLKYLKRVNPTDSESKLLKSAKKQAKAELRGALHKWFGLSTTQFDAWHDSTSSSEDTQSGSDDEDLDSDDVV